MKLKQKKNITAIEQGYHKNRYNIKLEQKENKLRMAALQN